MEELQGLTVFVSSGIAEFQNERVRLKNEIKQIGFLSAVVLEKEGARPANVVLESIRRSENCDIFVGILGENFSETSAKEYRAARAAKKPCFIYLLDVPKRSPDLERFIAKEVRPSLKYQVFATGAELIESIRNDLTRFVGEVLSIGIESWRKTTEFDASHTKRKEPPPEPKEKEAPIPVARESERKTIPSTRKPTRRRRPLGRDVPQRIRILEALAARGPMTTPELVTATGIYGGIMWMRLRELEKTGAIEVSRQKRKNVNGITSWGGATLREWYADEGSERERGLGPSYAR